MNQLKREIRVIGIDDGPFSKFKDKEVLVVGVVTRGGGEIDGVLSTKAAVDGIDSTAKIAAMVSKSKFRPQLRFILLDGIAVGGFNIVDIRKLHEKTGVPVIVVMRDYPDLEKIENILARIGKSRRIPLLRKAGRIAKAGDIFVQYCGTTQKRVKEVLKMTSTHSNIPEPLRIAHITAAGIVSGESRGRA